MRLIINADDLGFSKGINYGIYDAYKYGVVRSATLMMNMKATDHAIELLGDTGIGIGVHLNITAGQPLIQTHQHIVDEDGVFKKEYDFSSEELEEIECEFNAQLQLAYDKGVKVSHLDSHHHVHMWGAGIFNVTKKIAKKFNLKMRCNRHYAHMDEALQRDVQSTEQFSEEFFDQTVNVDYFLDIIKSNLSTESLEIMVHPGFLCGHLINRDSYREMRMVENSILTCTEVKTYIENNDIQLINYHQL